MTKNIPEIISITSTNINEWANTINSREILPVLLRKLIHSTISEIEYIDFPGYDNSQQPGADGVLKVNGIKNGWIPEGKSHWEFGTNKNPQKKANNDFENKSKIESEEYRKDNTFVFVTPRKFLKKEQWIEEKRKENAWKDIKIIDNNDLEQWIETAPEVQIWLADKMSLKIEGFQSLEEAWEIWIRDTKPKFTEEMFKVYLYRFEDTFKNWLENKNKKVLSIASESKEESLGFIYSMLNKNNLHSYMDKVVIVNSKKAADQIKNINNNAILIVSDIESEKILNNNIDKKLIIIKPNILNDSELDINLEILNFSEFQDSLEDLNLTFNEINNLAKYTGKSLTILRRQLTKNEAIKNPSWSTNKSISKKLIPYVFLGGIDKNYIGDLEILMEFSNEKNNDIIESNFNELISVDDSPVWKIANIQGIKSKIDAFYGLRTQISNENIISFFSIAKEIINNNEIIQSNKLISIKKYSNLLQRNVIETLVILMTNQNVFGKQLTVNIKNMIETFVNEEMNSINSDNISEKIIYFPLYAEATPQIFLMVILKKYLKDKKIIKSIIQSNDRVYLLHALEVLAWDPKNLYKVTRILLEMTQYQISDNLVNTPINTLVAIYSPIFPHPMSKSNDVRTILSQFIDEYSESLWEMTISILDFKNRITSISNTPKFNRELIQCDLSGLKNQILDIAKIDEFINFLDEFNNLDVKKLKKLLLISSQGIEDKVLETIFSKIENFAAQASDEEKSLLLDALYNHSYQDEKTYEIYLTRIKKLYELLKPKNKIIRYAPIFSRRYNLKIFERKKVYEVDDNVEVKKEKVVHYQTQKLKYFLEQNNIEDLVSLITYVDAPTNVANLLLKLNINKEELINIIYKQKSNANLEIFLRSYLFKLQSTEIEKIVRNICEDKVKCYVLSFTPINKKTLSYIESLQEKYNRNLWRNIKNIVIDQYDVDINFIINKLLENENMIEAINILFDYEKLNDFDTELLVKTLEKFSSKTKDFNTTKLSYEIKEIFSKLNESDFSNTAKLARLEIEYFKFLSTYNEYEFPNINTMIIDNEENYIELIKCISNETDKFLGINMNLYTHIHLVNSYIKFNNECTYEKIENWFNSVLLKLEGINIEKYGKQCLGHLIFNSMNNFEDIDNNEKFYKLLEHFSENDIYNGFKSSVINSLGAMFRHNGGEFERFKSKSYLAIANKLQSRFLQVSMMFEEISNSYEHMAEHWDIDYEIDKRLL